MERLTEENAKLRGDRCDVCDEDGLIYVPNRCDDEGSPIDEVAQSCPACGGTKSGYASRVTKERDEARARISELHTLIVKVTNETPYPEELQGWESQRRAMIAEVGTLRAERDTAIRERDKARARPALTEPTPVVPPDHVSVVMPLSLAAELRVFQRLSALGYVVDEPAPACDDPSHQTCDPGPAVTIGTLDRGNGPEPVMRSFVSDNLAATLADIDRAVEESQCERAIDDATASKPMGPATPAPSRQTCEGARAALQSACEIIRRVRSIAAVPDLDRWMGLAAECADTARPAPRAVTAEQVQAMARCLDDWRANRAMTSNVVAVAILADLGISITPADGGDRG